MFCNCYEFYRNMYLNEAGKQRELRTERDPGHIRLKAAGCLIAEFPIQWRPRDPHAKCQKSQGKQASQSLGCIRMNKDHSIIKVPSQEPSGVPVAPNYDWGFKSCNLYDNDASTTMVCARIDQVLASPSHFAKDPPTIDMDKCLPSPSQYLTLCGRTGAIQ